MNKRLVFRILGALASALIIISVFVPFVSVTGYSQSIWQTYKSLETLYLPIMIIIFGAIGVIAFAINVKTELAYTSTGALLFFLVLQTIPVIESKTFNTLSVGYYFLVIGTVLTGVMAFLCNLKQKIKEVPKQEESVKNQVSMLEQIDKLYDEQLQNNTIQENNTLNNIVQPLPIQGEVNNVVNPIPVQNNVNENIVQTQVIEPVPIQSLNNIEVVNQNNNSIVDGINQGMPQGNPVIQEFNQNVPQGNPVMQEFNQNVPQANPVASEFNPMVSQTIDQSQPNIVEPQPIANAPKVDIMADQTNNSNNSNLDIFG